MPSLLATIGANADPMRKELAEVEKMAQKLGYSLRKNIEDGGGHGGAKAGVLRETMVLIREISRGNWSRVPSSFSVLIDRLGELKYLLNPIAGAFVAAGAAAYFFFKHLKEVNEELDNTGNLFSRGFGKMADSMRKATNDAAVAAADFNHWLVKIGESQETVADKTADTIKLMREEAALRREANPDQRAGTRIKEAQEEREAEEKVLKDALEQQRNEERIAISKARIAEENSATSQDAIRRKGKIENLPSEIEGNKKDIDFYTKAQKKLQDKLDAGIETNYGGDNDPNLKNRADYKSYVKSHTESEEEIEIEGKKYLMSLSDASTMLDASTQLLETQQKQQARLAAIQKELADIAADSKKDAEKQKEATKKLTKEYNDLQKEIALHKKYDPAIEKVEEAKHGRNVHGHVNHLQQIGAFAAPAVHVDIAKRQLKVLQDIHHAIVQPKKGPMVGDFTRPDFGGGMIA